MVHYAAVNLYFFCKRLELSTIMEQKKCACIFVFSRLKQKYLKFAHLFPLKLGLPTADYCKLKNRAKFERKTADAISMFTTISMSEPRFNIDIYGSYYRQFYRLVF